MLESANEITYRGVLKSCNYKCSYCPFAKNSICVEEITKDEKRWWKFCSKVSCTSFQKPIKFLIAPYGEALIHSYYTKGIAALSKLNHIKIIGCQTNLSWDVNEWIKLLKYYEADFSKITLWCTYHPEMTSITEFVKKVEVLRGKVNLSVGVVGNPEAVEEIKKLREALPVEIYLWINNMDGMRRKYTREEINLFKTIDPMFELELMHFSEKNICSGGHRHFLVNARGDLYPCNRMKKVIGNLYSEGKVTYNFYNDDVTCKKKRCDCYLSYSHLEDIKALKFFGNQTLVRVPKRLSIKAIFLDVDGTILNREGKIDVNTKKALEYLSKKVSLYLMTQLPYDQAIKKCWSIKKLLSGGCFANGAHIVENKNCYEKYHYLESLPNLQKAKKVYVYTHENKHYKVMAMGELSDELLENNCYSVTNENGRISVVSKDVNKLQGVHELCKILKLNVNEIMAVGNSMNDFNVIDSVHYSVAVPNSPLALIEKAPYSLCVHHLPYII